MQARTTEEAGEDQENRGLATWNSASGDISRQTPETKSTGALSRRRPWPTEDRIGKKKKNQRLTMTDRSLIKVNQR